MRWQDGDRAWRAIRRLRAQPPGRADRDLNRRRVFQAALEQAEELFRSAEVAGPPSRPLPLFYMLSQAGRAIAAAWNDNEWEIKNHGLHVTVDRSALVQRRYPDMCRVRLNDSALGAFQVVSEAIGSPRFNGTVILGALWASLPGLETHRSLVGDQPRWVGVDAAWGSRHVGTICCRPDELAAKLESFPWAREYELVPDCFPGPAQPPTHSDLRWIDPATGEPRELGDVAEVVEASAFGATYVLRPPLGSGRDRPPRVVMSWWALLLALSTLARYHPAEWFTALDVDHSPVATSLEDALDEAMNRVPGLLEPALRRGRSVET